MAWPRTANAIGDLPMTDQGEEYSRMAPSHIGPALCQLIAIRGEVLDGITGGNPDKERLLGDILVQCAVMTASVQERYMQGGTIPS